MFSLKERFSCDTPLCYPGTESRAIFHPFQLPRPGTDVGDHFIKLLYYSSGPCGGPGCVPFRGHFLPRHMSRRAWLSLSLSPRSSSPVLCLRTFFLPSATLIPRRILPVLHFFMILILSVFAYNNLVKKNVGIINHNFIFQLQTKVEIILQSKKEYL